MKVCMITYVVLGQLLDDIGMPASLQPTYLFTYHFKCGLDLVPVQDLYEPS